MPVNLFKEIDPEKRDKLQVLADAIFQEVISKTPEQINNYFDNNLSALSTYTPEQIDNYIDAHIVDLPSAKAALAVLAKDCAFNSKHLKMLSKALVVLARRI